MHCSNCGKQINNVPFCPYCGSSNPFYQAPQPQMPTEESVTARLISLSLAGDKQASSDLISYVYHDMYNTALAVCHSAADADDAVQNACIKILSNLASLQNPDAFRPWCKSIVRKETLDILGKNYRKKDIFFTDMENQEDGLMYDPEDERIGYRPDLQMDNQTRQEIIMNILDSLPEDQRIVAMMYFYDSMKMKDIAAELGVEESTIVGRLQRAKKSIKSSVTALQMRDDIKLYNMSPLPFFIYLLSTWRFTAIETGRQAINQSALRLFGTAISGSSPVAGYLAGTAAARSSAAAASYGSAGVRSVSTAASAGNYGAGTAYSASSGITATSTAGTASIQNMSSGVPSYPPAGTAVSQGYYSASTGTVASQGYYPASAGTAASQGYYSTPNSAIPASQQIYQTAYNTGSSSSSYYTPPVNPMNMGVNAERMGAAAGAAATAGTAAAGAASSQAAVSAIAGTAAAETAKAAAGKGLIRALIILGLIGGTGTAGYYVISNDIVHVPYLSDIVRNTERENPSETIKRAETAMNEFDYNSFSEELEPGSYDNFRTSDSAAFATLRGFEALVGSDNTSFDFDVISTDMTDDTHCTVTASLSYNVTQFGTYDHTYTIPMVLHDNGKWYIIYNEVADENGVYAGFHFVY